MPKYKYAFAKYPTSSILEEIFEAAESLNNKLSKININDLNVSDYNKRYFGEHISTLGRRRLNLTKYSYVLAWALNRIERPLNEICFLDYGAGHGFLALLAKELGIGRVIHNDIYDISCKDAQEIAKELNLTADHYILGDIDDVIFFLDENSISCHSVGSYDVIEHIYDIEDFLNKNHLLSKEQISIFHASAANSKNPRINFKLKKIHTKIENTGRELKKGRKPTDASRPLIEIRKEMIRSLDKNLSKNEIEDLAYFTRGMMSFDIEKSVDIYEKEKKLPELINHPTNTCDPITGNWYEHLMDPDKLSKILQKNGFNALVISGYYDSPKSIYIRMIKKFLNLIISFLGKRGLFFAPFYAIHGFK